MKIIKVIGWVIVILGIMYFLYSIGGSHQVKTLQKERDEILKQKDSIRGELQKERHLRKTIYQRLKKEIEYTDSLQAAGAMIIAERVKTVRSYEVRIAKLSQLRGEEIFNTWINVYRKNKNDSTLLSIESLTTGPG